MHLPSCAIRWFALSHRFITCLVVIKEICERNTEGLRCTMNHFLQAQKQEGCGVTMVGEEERERERERQRGERGKASAQDKSQSLVKKRCTVANLMSTE